MKHLHTVFMPALVHWGTMSISLTEKVIIGLATVVVAVGLGRVFFNGTGIANSNTANSGTTSSCVITLFGTKYDVTQFRQLHPGGDVFACGTDMTNAFMSAHGNNMGLINQQVQLGTIKVVQ